MPRRKAVDGLYGRDGIPNGEESEEGADEGDENARDGQSRWSAIPNTKAWLVREEQRAQENRQHEDNRPYRRTEARSDVQRAVGPPQGRPRSAVSHDWRRAATYEPETNTQNRDDGMQYDEEGMMYERTGWEEGAQGGFRGPGLGGAIPTVVAREEGVADAPVTVENPQDDKWAVHLEDPETLLKGLSADYIKVVWWGSDPTVIFTVYNYKYTENGAINRHIENTVTSMTTALTGETGFAVIPPDPDTRYRLQSRDLPFIWAIRGLSEAGAWEMVKIRVATSKGVTIITHPRSLTNPRWVCGLGGFLRPDGDAIKKTVLSSLCTDYMLGRLADLTRSNEALRHIPEARRVDHVLGSLQIDQGNHDA